jgi:hypothetical protein
MAPALRAGMNEDTSETEKETAAGIAESAKEAFAGHTLKVIGEGEWLCRRPGSGSHHFYVIARRGVLIVYGDLGEYVLRMHDPETVAWLWRAVNSYDYLFGKVMAVSRNDGSPKCWYWQDAANYLRERIEEHRKDEDTEGEELYRRVLAAAADGGDYGITQDWFLECCSDGELDDMGSVGVGFAAGMWWLLEALRKFTQLLKAAEPAEQAAAG